jgi:hypothetical protein
MLLGKIKGDRIKEVGIMKEVKEKAIELLLDIISKEHFEVMLYEKVKSEDLIKNKLLFELVNINYRKDFSKDKVLDIYKGEINEKMIIINKVNFYCSKIISSKTNIDIISWFQKAENLFSILDDYDLMWDFIELSDRLGFVYLKYEKEEEVLKDIKFFSFNLIDKLEKALTIEDKYKILEDGIDVKFSSNKKWYEFWRK